MSFLKPDRYFARLSSINITVDIVQHGFECVLLDVDNTVFTRGTRIVPSDIALWLHNLEEAKIKPCFLSNNFHDDVLAMASSLNIPIVAKALKPLPFGYLKACKTMDVSKKKTLMIGDQLSTDIFGAHFLGMKAYLVCPLVEEDLKHTKVIRFFENALIRNINLE